MYFILNGRHLVISYDKIHVKAELVNENTKSGALMVLTMDPTFMTDES